MALINRGTRKANRGGFNSLDWLVSGLAAPVYHNSKSYQFYENRETMDISTYGVAGFPAEAVRMVNEMIGGGE